MINSLSHIIAEKPHVALGQRFGNRVVLGVPFILPFNGRNPSSRTQFAVCECDCGSVDVVLAANLIAGRAGSCRSCQTARKSMTHGWCGTRLHRIWLSMNARCTYPSCQSWHRYGGRGISVCDAWAQDFVPFKEWALASGYEDGLSIDRINNSGNYEPSNCRWATKAVQANNRDVTVLVTAFGETKSASEWSRDSRCVTPYRTLVRRIHAGVNPEAAITTRGAISLKQSV